ncbi:MAG: hypothetical protein Q7S31_00100 [bacterium]|nr:hypothetical protein [bacterium]
MLKHICGQCNKAFSSEKAYLHHQCPTTGSTPVQSPLPQTQPKGSKLTEKNIVAAVRTLRQAKQHV